MAPFGAISPGTPPTACALKLPTAAPRRVPSAPGSAADIDLVWDLELTASSLSETVDPGTMAPGAAGGSPSPARLKWRDRHLLVHPYDGRPVLVDHWLDTQDPDRNGNNCFQNGAAVEAMHLASDEDGGPGEQPAPSRPRPTPVFPPVPETVSGAPAARDPYNS
jgi:hypothetical protein